MSDFHFVVQENLGENDRELSAEGFNEIQRQFDVSGVFRIPPSRYCITTTAHHNLDSEFLIFALGGVFSLGAFSFFKSFCSEAGKDAYSCLKKLISGLVAKKVEETYQIDVSVVIVARHENHNYALCLDSVNRKCMTIIKDEKNNHTPDHIKKIVTQEIDRQLLRLPKEIERWDGFRPVIESGHYKGLIHVAKYQNGKWTISGEEFEDFYRKHLGYGEKPFRLKGY